MIGFLKRLLGILKELINFLNRLLFGDSCAKVLHFPDIYKWMIKTDESQAQLKKAEPDAPLGSLVLGDGSPSILSPSMSITSNVMQVSSCSRICYALRGPDNARGVIGCTLRFRPREIPASNLSGAFSKLKW